jgi:site-specific DNA recombinase
VIAAIYARKSTDQNVSDEEKSIARQVEHARAFAARRGWRVAEEHVYIDDGISGAEFVRRPGLTALLAALRARPAPVQVVITMELSRLGREQTDTAIVLREIIRAGVRVFTYGDGREITLESALDKFQLSALTFVAEMERELSRTRTRAAMVRKAARGHVAGGKVYGYSNREIGVAGADGRVVRDHVEHVIVEAEAVIIRRIFSEAAAGRGFARIAKALNVDGIPSPARGRGWATSGVREILFRERYRGRQIYGRTRRVDRDGRTRRSVPTPSNEWTVVEQPDLRIVTEEAWQAAHARLTTTRELYRKSGRGALWGHPAAIAGGHGSRYLLSGLLLCGQCGWGLHATHRTSQRGAPQRYYVCTAHRTRGETVCTNRYSAPMDALHAEVLATLRRKVLKPDLVRDVVRRALEIRAARPAAREERREALTSELTRLDAELRRYAEAIALGEPLPSILEAMRGREQRRHAIRAELDELGRKASRAPLTDVAVYREALRRLVGWTGLLARHPSEARGVLQDLLCGRIVVKPVVVGGERWFDFRGEATLGGLFHGLIGGVNGVVAPG